MLNDLTNLATTGTILLPVLALLIIVVFWQDMKERQVSLVVLLLLLLGCAGRFLLSGEPGAYLLINSSFLLIHGIALYGYLFVKYRTLQLGSYLGAGDVLFWLACLWCFSPLNFLLFFLSSLLGALLLHLFLCRLLNNYKHVYIPLAGFQGLFLIFALVMERISPHWSTYNDYPLLKTLGLT
jgi:Flp pilus assembly protein protease CpaA